MSSVQVQYTGNGQFSYDIKVSEDLALRGSLQGGAAATTLVDDDGRPVALSQLAGNAQWEALQRRPDINVTTSSTDRQPVTFMAALVAAVPAVGADDVIIEAALNADYDILSVVLAPTASAAATVTLRDATGGLGNALSNAISDAAPPTKTADDGSLGIPVALKGTSLVARRSDDQTEGSIVVTALRR
jgi:hypothetical protein